MKNGVSIFDTTFTVCDVETTGLSPLMNRIIEFGAVKIKNGEITDRYSTLINPGQFIPREITALTGIKNEDVYDKPTFGEIQDDIKHYFSEDDKENFMVFSGHNVLFDYKFISSSFLRLPQPVQINLKTLCTCKLARRLFRKLKSKSLQSICDHLGIRQKNKHRALDDALATAKILLHFLELLNEEYEFDSINDVLKFQNSKIYTDTNRSPALKRMNLQLKDLPRKPGVYFMKSKNGDLLYIGKAKSLRERLSSYFRHNSEMPPKIKRLITNVWNLEYEVTNSELSALILESKLIKQHKPRFNSAIKRFRFHPFLKIDVQNDYPRIDKVYEIENDGANYYGPFANGITVNRLMKDIKENFMLRKCDFKTLKPRHDHSTCMYYEMSKCKAPCNFTQSHAEYIAEVNNVHTYICSNGEGSVQKIYENNMKILAERMDFERAAFLRDRLSDIMRVMSYQKVITSAINNKKIIIKCDDQHTREIFFIHNGKLVQTYILDKKAEFDQRNVLEELTDTTDYLFFSLSKYVRHRYTPQELDEIKVISNWLAVNTNRNMVFEINDERTKEDILRFVMS